MKYPNDLSCRQNKHLQLKVSVNDMISIRKEKTHNIVRTCLNLGSYTFWTRSRNSSLPGVTLRQKTVSLSLGNMIIPFVS